MTTPTTQARVREVLGPRPPFKPICLGPTWRKTDEGRWDLPELTLGWAVIAWCAKWLNGADGERGWKFTPEQARFILWYYAVDATGRWIYREAVLQRVKGWG
jgi:hypothetical protein